MIFQNNSLRPYPSQVLIETKEQNSSFNWTGQERSVTVQHIKDLADGNGPYTLAWRTSVPSFDGLSGEFILFRQDYPMYRANDIDHLYVAKNVMDGAKEGEIVMVRTWTEFKEGQNFTATYIGRYNCKISPVRPRP